MIGLVNVRTSDAKIEQRLKRDNVNTESQACYTHNKIGKIVRNAIKEAGRNYA